MKNKRIIIIMLLIILIFGIVVKCYFNIKKENYEYVPEEEISEEQIRQTIITLYFKNTENGEISSEIRRIDVALLAKNPFEYLVKCLLEKPKNEKLDNFIPKETKLNKVELNGETLIIDFSYEFIKSNVKGKEEEIKILKSIFSTVTQLKEVNKIKILIDGEEGKSFDDNEVSFNDDFTLEKLVF